MEPHQTSVRARKGAAGALGVSPKASPKVATSPLPDVKGGDASKYRAQATALPASTHGMTWKRDGVALLILTAVAAFLRFYLIWHPSQVVFDEVHFGKFAAYYLRREYYFDVHPPLAKLLNAFAGWVVGFKGDFDFENISDDYIKNNVPYIGMRAFPAIMGTLAVPIVYAIMRETGHDVAVALLSGSLLAFDNAHITQDRLILLDAALVLFMIASIYCYVRFYKERYNEFSAKWWFWMVATGVNLALTMSCKMVGLLTFMSVGVAVAFDLWKLLDVRRGLPIEHVGRHFFARVLGLIIIPACVYIFWFWVHFAILTKSGTGDAFMSSQFQQTLEGNAMLAQAKDIHWGDSITLKHKGTDAYLHSHVDRYPLKYDDGRISSQGQQVTGYPFNDTNNVWQIVRPEPLPADSATDLEARIVKNHDVIRLRHLNTNSYLMAHDVASPLMATNEEFTTFPANDTSRFKDTLFEMNIDGVKETSRKPWKSKSTWFRLVHVETRVSMWTHTETPLPEWGFAQQEINGNKNTLEKTAMWFVDDLYPDATADDYAERIKPLPPRKKGKMSFFKKFAELQLTMLHQNSQLTQSHPYATGPLNWPFLLQGISFWTENSTLQQIYMIGNVVGWWITILSVSVFVGIMAADTLARRRGLEPIEPEMYSRMLNSAGFFFGAWAFHYFPFFLMNRQLFLHHYLPAHVCSCLLAGSVFNFVASETVNYPLSRPGPLLLPNKFRARTDNVMPSGAKVAVAVVVAALVACFWRFSPLTYGYPGLSPEQVNSLKWPLGWSLHFAK